MSKTRAELNAAADARARALGFTNRSQAYRAGKVGYKGKGSEYNAVLEQKHATGIVKRAARGNLLGLKSTQAGTVISADLWEGQGKALWRELARYRGDRQVRVTIETGDGDVIEVGGRGGMRLSYLREMHHKFEGGSCTGPKGRRPRGGTHIVTVTVV